ncbi:MAG: hypothetical protein LBM66_07090 [Bifidobacteriaceae bacterium]|nr:hypothetical protein [Bifidobacteriaceae bacterium]
MAIMTTYTVTAERSGRWWALQCREVPGAISQVRRLNQADEIKEAIAFVAGVPEADVEIAVIPRIPAEAQRHLDRARELRKEADTARHESALETRMAARKLANDGLTMREIGQVLGVSHQRAAQLLVA